MWKCCCGCKSYSHEKLSLKCILLVRPDELIKNNETTHVEHRAPLHSNVSSVFPQVTFYWASTLSIWPSWPTMRPFLCWRLRQLSPRWYSVSYRPSPRTQRRTVRLSTRTNWTLWTTYETTPSTGRRCGLAGWDYPGRASFNTSEFSSSTSSVFC